MYMPDLEKLPLSQKMGTYCYRVMPFGLKNAEPTYQRMVNKAFKDLLGNIVEAYMPDMIIKSKSKESHVKKLMKVFNVLLEHNM